MIQVSGQQQIERFRSLPSFFDAVSDYCQFCTEPVEQLNRVHSAGPGLVQLVTILHIPSMPGHAHRMMECTVPVEQLAAFDDDSIGHQDFSIELGELAHLLQTATCPP